MPRSIAASLIVIYSAGAGVVQKGNLKQRKAISLTIVMLVDAVFAFACIYRNISGHMLMDRPATRLETMALVISSYVLVCLVGKRR